MNKQINKYVQTINKYKVYVHFHCKKTVYKEIYHTYENINIPWELVFWNAFAEFYQNALKRKKLKWKSFSFGAVVI